MGLSDAEAAGLDVTGDLGESNWALGAGGPTASRGIPTHGDASSGEGERGQLQRGEPGRIVRHWWQRSA